MNGQFISIMVVKLFMYVIVLSMLFGGLCCISGEDRKGSQILVNCLTATTLYMVIVQLAHSGLPADSPLSQGLPLINHMRQAGGIRDLLYNSPKIFAGDFVELVTLILLIQWIANLISFPCAGFAGKLTSSIVIVFIGVIAYGYVMLAIQDTFLIKWCVYCVEYILTGGSILYTPAMLLSFILGLKKDNYTITYFMSVFPKTSIGKAIASSLASAVVFVVFALSLERQCGSLCNVLAGGLEAFECSGSVIVILMGIYFLITGLKAGNR